MKNKATCLSRAPQRAVGRVHRHLWVAATSAALAIHAHAMTCINNLPPSNPDAVYTVSGNGTATDTRNGLMWKVCVEGQTWGAGACSGVASTFPGPMHWRMPRVTVLPFEPIGACPT